jgi:hypothetical protein
MERHLWILNRHLRQPSNTYGNLIAAAFRHCGCVAVAAMCPELYQGSKKLPQASMDIGHGFVFLRPQDRSYMPSEVDSVMERAFVRQSLSTTDPIKRWGRLRLANGQVARSFWQEAERSKRKNIRISRNVKVSPLFSKYLKYPKSDLRTVPA